MTFATVTTLCRNIASPHFTPVAVEFQHESPADISEHLRLFCCPVRFGAPSNRFTFASDVLSLSIERADASLCAVLDRHAEEMLAKYPPRDSLVDRVQSIITNEFRGGDPSLDRIADQLGLTPRTLQRKLHELGTCDDNSRCDICANRRWRSARLLTCSGFQNRAPSTVPSNAGPALRQKSTENGSMSLCAISVFSVSLWLLFGQALTTTESQRTRRLHGEQRAEATLSNLTAS